MSIKTEYYPTSIFAPTNVSSQPRCQQEFNLNNLLQLCRYFGLCNENWQLQYFPENLPYSQGIEEILEGVVTFENGNAFSHKNWIENLLNCLPPTRFQVYLRGSCAAQASNFQGHFAILIESFVAKSPQERAPLLQALKAFQHSSPQESKPADVDWLFLASKEIDAQEVIKIINQFGEYALGPNCYKKNFIPRKNLFARKEENIVIVTMKSHPKVDLVVGNLRQFSLSHADDFYIPIQTPRSPESKGTNFWQAVFYRSLKIFPLEKWHSDDFYALLGAIQRLTVGYSLIEEEGASLSRFLGSFLIEPIDLAIEKIVARIENHVVDPLGFLFNFCIHIPKEQSKVCELIWSHTISHLSDEQLEPFAFLRSVPVPFLSFASELKRFWTFQKDSPFYFPDSFIPLEERSQEVIDQFQKLLLFKLNYEPWLENCEYREFALNCRALYQRNPEPKFLKILLQRIIEERFFNSREQKNLLKILSPDGLNSISLNEVLDHLVISSFTTTVLPYWENSGGCEKARLEELLKTPGLKDDIKRKLLQVAFKKLTEDQLLDSLHELFQNGLIFRKFLFDWISTLLTPALFRKILTLQWDSTNDQEILRLLNQLLDSESIDTESIHNYLEALPEKKVPVADKIRLIWKLKELGLFPYSCSKMASEMENMAIHEIPSPEFARMVENLIDKGHLDKTFQILSLFSKEPRETVIAKLISSFNQSEPLNAVEYYPRLITAMDRVTPEVLQLYKTLLLKNNLSERLRIIQGFERVVPETLLTPLSTDLLLDNELFPLEAAKVALLRILQREKNYVRALQLLWKIEKRHYLPEPKELREMRDKIFKNVSIEFPHELIQEELNYLKKAKEIRKYLDLLALLQKRSKDFNPSIYIQNCLEEINSIHEAVQFFSHQAVRTASRDGVQISLDWIDALLDQAKDSQTIALAHSLLTIPFIRSFYEPRLLSRLCTILSLINQDPLHFGETTSKWLNILGGVKPVPLDLESAQILARACQTSSSIESPSAFFSLWRESIEAALADSPETLLLWYLVLRSYKIQLPEKCPEGVYHLLKERIARSTPEELKITIYFFARSPRFSCEALPQILQRVELLSLQPLFEELIPEIAAQADLYLPQRLSFLRKLTLFLLDSDSSSPHACKAIQAYSTHKEIEPEDCEFLLKRLNARNCLSVNWQNILAMSYSLRTLKVVAHEIIKWREQLIDRNCIEVCALKLLELKDLSPFIENKTLLQMHLKEESVFQRAVECQITLLLAANNQSNAHLELITNWSNEHIELFADKLMEYLARTPKKIDQRHMHIFKSIFSIHPDRLDELLKEQAFQNNVRIFLLSDFFKRLLFSNDEFAIETFYLVLTMVNEQKTKIILLDCLLEHLPQSLQKRAIDFGLIYLIDYPRAPPEIVEKIFSNTWTFCDESIPQCALMIKNNPHLLEGEYKKRPLLQLLNLSIQLKAIGDDARAIDLVKFIDAMLYLRLEKMNGSLEYFFFSMLSMMVSEVKNEFNLFEIYFYSYLTVCLSGVYEGRHEDVTDSYLNIFKVAPQEKHLQSCIRMEKLLHALVTHLNSKTHEEFNIGFKLIMNHIKMIYKLPHAKYYVNYFDSFILAFLSCNLITKVERQEITKIHPILYRKGLVRIRDIFIEK